jgi:hypothetical protein
MLDNKIIEERSEFRLSSLFMKQSGGNKSKAYNKINRPTHFWRNVGYCNGDILSGSIKGG